MKTIKNAMSSFDELIKRLEKDLEENIKELERLNGLCINCKKYPAEINEEGKQAFFCKICLDKQHKLIKELKRR